MAVENEEEGEVEGQFDGLLDKIEALEEYTQTLEERIRHLENVPFQPSQEYSEGGGVDFSSIDKFVDKFMEKNPVDIGKVKPLQLPGFKNFEIDLMPPAVEKHLYSNIISLLLGFFNNELQMEVANHRIRTSVSCVRN